MTHELWENHQWQAATEEEVISALFNAPAFLHPFDMADINHYHPQAKSKYLNLFYLGNIPQSVKKLNKL